MLVFACATDATASSLRLEPSLSAKQRTLARTNSQAAPAPAASSTANVTQAKVAATPSPGPLGRDQSATPSAAMSARMKARETAQKLLWDQDSDSDEEDDEAQRMDRARSRANDMVEAAKKRAHALEQQRLGIDPRHHDDDHNNNNNVKEEEEDDDDDGDEECEVVSIISMTPVSDAPTPNTGRETEITPAKRTIAPTPPTNKKKHSPSFRERMFGVGSSKKASSPSPSAARLPPTLSPPSGLTPPARHNTPATPMPRATPTTPLAQGVRPHDRARAAVAVGDAPTPTPLEPAATPVVVRRRWAWSPLRSRPKQAATADTSSMPETPPPRPPPRRLDGGSTAAALEAAAQAPSTPEAAQMIETTVDGINKVISKLGGVQLERYAADQLRILRAGSAIANPRDERAKKVLAGAHLTLLTMAASLDTTTCLRRLLPALLVEPHDSQRRGRCPEELHALSALVRRRGLFLSAPQRRVVALCLARCTMEYAFPPGEDDDRENDALSPTSRALTREVQGAYELLRQRIQEITCHLVSTAAGASPDDAALTASEICAAFAGVCEMRAGLGGTSPISKGNDQSSVGSPVSPGMKRWAALRAHALKSALGYRCVKASLAMLRLKAGACKHPGEMEEWRRVFRSLRRSRSIKRLGLEDFIPPADGENGNRTAVGSPRTEAAARRAAADAERKRDRPDEYMIDASILPEKPRRPSHAPNSEEKKKKGFHPIRLLSRLRPRFIGGRRRADGSPAGSKLTTPRKALAGSTPRRAAASPRVARRPSPKPSPRTPARRPSSTSAAAAAAAAAAADVLADGEHIVGYSRTGNVIRTPRSLAKNVLGSPANTRRMYGKEKPQTGTLFSPRYTGPYVASGAGVHKWKAASDEAKSVVSPRMKLAEMATPDRASGKSTSGVDYVSLARDYRNSFLVGKDASPGGASAAVPGTPPGNLPLELPAGEGFVGQRLVGWSGVGRTPPPPEDASGVRTYRRAVNTTGAEVSTFGFDD